MAELPFAARTTALVLDVKLVLLTGVFVYAFFRFTWSLRHTASAPWWWRRPRRRTSSATRRGRRDRFADRAGGWWAWRPNRSTTACAPTTLPLPPRLWLFSPVAFAVGTAGVVWILYQREFRSEALTLLGGKAFETGEHHSTMTKTPPILLRNAVLFDSERGRLQPATQILVEGDRIAAVTTEAVASDGREVIDVAGRVVLPGLIDAHVHVTAASNDLIAQALEAPSLIVARTAAIMKDMLHRGFTSVRDAAGADHGLQEAVAKGLFAGPRLYIAGFPISQTGGHADMRPRAVRHEGYFCTCAGLGLLGAIADGVGEARKRTREQVRTGATRSRSWPAAALPAPPTASKARSSRWRNCARSARRPRPPTCTRMAHAYSPRAVTRAVQAGVRSIEHGNLIDEATVKVMKSHGAYLVPTLSTYAAFSATGRQPGWTDDMVAKFQRVESAGVQSLHLAKAAGVPIVYGTDLLGPMHERQLGEFLLRAPALTPIEQLQGATHTAARLMGQEAHIGSARPGAFADLIVMEGDPTQDIGLMAELPRHMKLLMQGGRPVLRAW